MINLLFRIGLFFHFFVCSAFAEVDHEKIYNDSFPQYAEVCGFTRMDGGGPGGHAIIYLKGVCRDRGAPYPRVQLCEESDTEKGTLLSVDRSFKNVEWVGIEDRDFGLYGGLDLDEPLDVDVFSQVRKSAYESRAFRGIQTDDVSNEQPLEVREYLIAHKAMSTDYAITFARKGSCWKLPLVRDQLQAMVDYANSLNDLHQNPETPYVWNALGNNCTHFIVNLLASAHVLKPVKTGAFFPGNLFKGLPRAEYQLITPSSLAVKIEKKVRQQKIPSIEAAFKDTRTKESLEKFGRIPFQHGVILGTLKFHQAGNSKYKLHAGRAGRPGDQEKVETMEQDLDLQDLTLNLVTYYGLYLKAYDQIPPLEKIHENSKKLDNNEFNDFYRIHSEWLLNSIGEVEEKLLALGVDVKSKSESFHSSMLVK